MSGIVFAACSPIGDSSYTDAPLSITGAGQPLSAPTTDVVAAPTTDTAAQFANAGSLGSTAGRALPFVRSPAEQVPPFPIELNAAVQAVVDDYRAQPAGIDGSFSRIKPYLAEMTATLKQEGLPSDLVYLTFAESGFSSSGAGPWQLSRSTARRYGLEINNWIDERRDPIKSTRAAAAYLSELHQDVGADWRMTLVAWNNGEGGAERYLSLSGADYTRMMKRLPRHTRSLLNRFMAAALIARHRRASGELQAQQTKPFKIVSVKGGTTLRAVAERHHTSLDLLRYLNPALFRHRTPPNATSYPIRIPAESLHASL